MLRKMLLVFGLCGFAALGARAQDENKVEVFGGYSYLHFHTNPSTNLNGWELAGQYRFRDWLGGVADFDGHYGSFSGGTGASTHTFLFGPQVSIDRKSTRLNSSHGYISYAVFCFKKKKLIVGG